jgi:LAS superfamily LD-carboxypeptidase LdcB
MANHPPSPAILAGRTDAHLATCDDEGVAGVRLHAGVVADFRALRAAAAADGFDLRVHSAFRDFGRQRSIWNRKATGGLAVLDSDARPIDIRLLTPAELVLAIMRWSALPGASRHHWGTDLDVFDAVSTPPGYEIQLVPAEVDAGGMHSALHEWLDARIATGSAWGFYRPYDRDRGGVAPERWHLSHAPIATEYLAALTPTLLRQTIETGDLQLGDAVLDTLDDLYLRFVTNINPPPSSHPIRPVVA